MVADSDRETRMMRDAVKASANSGPYGCRDEIRDAKQVTTSSVSDMKLKLIEEARDAVKRQPRHAESHIQLAQSLHTVSKFEEAVVHYKRGLELKPSLASTVLPDLMDTMSKISKSKCRYVLLPCAITREASHRGSSGTCQASDNSETYNDWNKHNRIFPQVYDAAVMPWEEKIGAINARLIATACGDGIIRVYCAVTGCMLESLKGHKQAVTTLSWSNSCDLLISGSLDKTARIWTRRKHNLFGAGSDDKNAGIKSIILEGHTGRVSCVKFTKFCKQSKTENIAITASTDQTVRIWNGSTGACLHVLSGHSALVSDIALSPGRNSTTLVTSSGDAVFRVWDIESGQLTQEVNWESGPVVLTGFLPCKPVRGFADENHHSCEESGSDLEDEFLSQENPLLLTAHAQLMRSEARVLLWDILEKKSGWVDGRLSAPSKSVDGLRGRPTGWDSVITEDGSVLVAVASTDGTGCIYDVTDAPISYLNFPLSSIGIDPDLINPKGFMDDIPAWRAETLAKASYSHNLVKFSPGGEHIAYSGADHAIGVISVDDGEQLTVFVGHTQDIRQLIWLDNRKILSASEDGSVRIWQL